MILSTLGAAMLVVAGAQETERVVAPDFRDEIHRVIGAQSDTERNNALDALRAGAGEEHEVLLRELFRFFRESTNTREAMAFALIRGALSVPDEHLIRALVPLFEQGDDTLNAALSDVLSEFEQRSPVGGPDFAAYLPFLTSEPRPGLMRHMMATDRDAALRTLARAREREGGEALRWVEQVVAMPPALARATGIRPVTDDDLANPSPDDWLMWRRTADGQGHSPLDQITTENVDRLRPVWVWNLEPGSGLTTPLVHDGVLYVANHGQSVQALDAATGDFIWEYWRDAPPRGDSLGSSPPARRHHGLAIYENKVYLNAADAHITAIDARTGEEVWDTDVGTGGGFQYSSGSIVANGRVVAGLDGCGSYLHDMCYIVGLDARTGDQLWRLSTFPRPGGDPGDNSWANLPPNFRAGSTSRLPGSYDPVTNTLYHGISAATGAGVERGTGGSALYTNSTLALDPGTGSIRWLFQHIPNELLSTDEGFERILIDYDGQRSVFSMGNMAVLWELDADTGAFRSAHDLGYQNFADIDPLTGMLTYREGMIAEYSEKVDRCPGTAGFKNWQAMSYSPETQAFVIPINLYCETVVFGATEWVERGVTDPELRISHFHPDSPGQIGELLSMSIRTGEVLWRQRFETPISSSALTTAGGLAFAGSWDRYIYAFDVTDGEILWRYRLPASIQGSPISYTVDDRQYVAVLVGTGEAISEGTIPANLMPDERRAVGGDGLFVFSLTEE